MAPIRQQYRALQAETLRGNRDRHPGSEAIHQMVLGRIFKDHVTVAMEGTLGSGMDLMSRSFYAEPAAHPAVRPPALNSINGKPSRAERFASALRIFFHLESDRPKTRPGDVLPHHRNIAQRVAAINADLALLESQAAEVQARRAARAEAARLTPARTADIMDSNLKNLDVRRDELKAKPGNMARAELRAVERQIAFMTARLAELPADTGWSADRETQESRVMGIIGDVEGS